MIITKESHELTTLTTRLKGQPRTLRTKFEAEEDRGLACPAPFGFFWI